MRGMVEGCVLRRLPGVKGGIACVETHSEFALLRTGSHDVAGRAVQLTADDGGVL